MAVERIIPGLRHCTRCMVKAPPLSHPTLGDICVMCMRPFQGAPPMPMSKKERRTQKREPERVVTSAMVCQAIRQYGVIPDWMREQIDAQADRRPGTRSEFQRRQKKQKPKNPKRGSARSPIKHNRRLAIYQRDGMRCVGCGSTDYANFTLDHKTPLSRGGTNASENLQTMCRPCNHQKRAMTMEEFLDWREHQRERDRAASIAYREQHGQRPRKELAA